jgi:hypothetical protein
MKLPTEDFIIMDRFISLLWYFFIIDLKEYDCILDTMLDENR